MHLVGAPLFSWDKEKAPSNLEKQGVSFVEAATVFGDFGAMFFSRILTTRMTKSGFS